MEILTRDAIFEDYKQIADISIAAYQEYAKALTKENWQKMKQSLSNVEQTAKNADYIVAEINNKIVGAIAYYPPDKSNPKYFDSNCASLRLLAVDPNYQSRGIGKLLTQTGIDRAKRDKAKAIGLYTSAIMTAAQTMYSSLGFIRTRELPAILGLQYYLYILPFDGSKFSKN